MSIVSTNIRFNLEKEADWTAWEHLQRRDKREHRSYSRAVIVAVNDYFDRRGRLASDPYLETREKEDAFLLRVLDTIRAGLSQGVPTGTVDTLLKVLQGCQFQPAPAEESPREEQQEADDHGVIEVKQRIASMESSLEKLDQQERKYFDELNVALAQYAELQQQAENMDVAEVDTVRQSIRHDMEHEATRRLQGAYGKPLDYQVLTQSRKDVADFLGETSEPSIHQKLRQPHTQQAKRHPTKEHDQER